MTLPVETLKSVPPGKAVWNANAGFVSVLLTHLWYIWFTLAHFTFGTLVGTLSVLVILLVHQAAFGTLESFLECHFGYDWYIVTFGTAVAFWYTEDRINVYYTSEFWYVWFTLAHLTFGTPAGTLHQLVH